MHRWSNELRFRCLRAGKELESDHRLAYCLSQAREGRAEWAAAGSRRSTWSLADVATLVTSRYSFDSFIKASIFSFPSGFRKISMSDLNSSECHSAW